MKIKKQKSRLIILSIIVTALIAASFLTLTNPKISRYHFGAGGESSGGGFTLVSSIGQHDAGDSMTGGGFTLQGGFWTEGGEADYLVYIPLATR